MPALRGERCTLLFKFPLPIYVDTLTDEGERNYTAWPDRIYILDPESKIAYKGGPGPRGFSIPDADEALDKLLNPSER